ncbi:RICIN domain-containing protein [Limnoglobus roseus]|uniref:Ricin-type beta-trefoil lectin domain-containing protein n=1 Tax=Limnoglobus roseus TaxID=2598579 RepID=A0A5C1ARC9_9BACT|nr:RICIN domain-containing protein [Limnoglobus roseus]QEL20536.1 ricin-type beta-trefoil lectin domain-containing protein [Limnoglobus roseus]
MFNRLMLGHVVVLVATTGLIAAPPDAVLKSTVERFEKSIADAEGKLRANLDKALTRAKDRAAREEIAYQIEQFDKVREVPAGIPTKEYVQSRDTAISALASQFETRIKSLRSAKKTAAADDLEGEYAALVKKARDFGIAMPDPAPTPLVVIRNKASGGVLEAVDPKRGGSKVLVANYVQGRVNQVWRLERGAGGVAFRSAGGNLYLHVPASSQTEGEQLVLWGPEKVNEHFSWKGQERLREVSLVSCFNGLALSSKVITEKGQTATYLTQEKLPEKPTVDQVWKIEVQK